ncbi:hypothetical protein GOM44_06445 [Wolbachia endosymbiont of Atemnus politus]|uniref:hypothetical protein n=1 Tax=Wolbachia endosymbiont of Atemnus politus TaxID=2682840 RepID=UPI001571A229|nr:hypothetical protein [Wolbachia endosymbiont of Atemnus politus]NSX83822.1 hypothetical protein [Wolbachia endosymbiont of Atemnus politus]
MRNGKFSEIPKILYSFAKEACPNYKQTDKFLAIFKDCVERTLVNNEQLESSVISNAKRIGNEQPRSFMSDVTHPSSFRSID